MKFLRGETLESNCLQRLLGRAVSPRSEVNGKSWFRCLVEALWTQTKVHASVKVGGGWYRVKRGAMYSYIERRVGSLRSFVEVASEKTRTANLSDYLLLGSS